MKFNATKLENQDIRSTCYEYGFPLHALAYKKGISDTTLSKWLRRPLPESLKNELMELLEQMKAENAQTEN